MNAGTRVKAIRGPYAKRFLFGTVIKFEMFDLSGPGLVAECVTEYTIAFENGHGNVLDGLPSVAVLSGRDLVSL